MAELVNLTVDGKPLSAEKGTLLIEAAKKAGISIPAFCYYEGYSLQAACRMCLVEVEKMPKLQPGCTLPVAEGMVVYTDSPKVVESRKSTLEFLLANHPLDCPVCDKGGECELQDMVFRYGVAESQFVDIKNHTDEKQWSPLVYYDAPRCILCYRCVRVCEEGMGVQALGLGRRGTHTEIIPNKTDHLECDECGNCIDICPVGALTSGTYRYQTRPWEMQYSATVCTHCADGCKTTLAVRNGEIVRANNRDRSGVNGEFLCGKGRFAFDFVKSEERLQSPLVRKNGKLEPASWGEALAVVAKKFAEVKARNGKFGVVASTLLTNEELFYLQRFARHGLNTNNIDHARSGDVATLLNAVKGRDNALATIEDLYTSKAALVIGSDLAHEHPLIAFQLRANFRHHRAAVYTVTRGAVREADYAARAIVAEAGQELVAVEGLRDELAKHAELVVAFGATVQGESIRKLVGFCDSLGIKVRYIALVDDANSRGAYDMGATYEFGPGYSALNTAGQSAAAFLADTSLDVLWAVGADALKDASLAASNAFVVVQDLFLTATAERADVVLPSASLYEKSGTVTNTCGEVQRLKVGPRVMGTKSDLEIIGLLSKEMGLETKPWTADAVFAEIRQTVRGYNVPLAVVATGGAAQAGVVNETTTSGAAARSHGWTRFTSAATSHCKTLSTAMEAPGALYER